MTIKELWFDRNQTNQERGNPLRNEIGVFATEKKERNKFDHLLIRDKTHFGLWSQTCIETKSTFVLEQ